MQPADALDDCSHALFGHLRSPASSTSSSRLSVSDASAAATVCRALTTATRSALPNADHASGAAAHGHRTWDGGIDDDLPSREPGATSFQHPRQPRREAATPKPSAPVPPRIATCSDTLDERART